MEDISHVGDVGEEVRIGVENVEEHRFRFIRYISGSDHFKRTAKLSTQSRYHVALVCKVWGVQGCKVNYKVLFTLMTS